MSCNFPYNFLSKCVDKGIKIISHLPPKQSVSINIRAKTPQLDLIDEAAKRIGLGCSNFMLDAACRQAEEVLLDQAFFMVDEGTFKKFQALLDKPLPVTDKLRRLLKTKAPYDK